MVKNIEKYLTMNLYPTYLLIKKRVIWIAVFFIVFVKVGYAASDANTPKYVSSTVCAGCHQAEHKAWSNSHHSWALRVATSKNVLGDFNETIFMHKNIRSRFYKSDSKYFIETVGEDGKLSSFEIKYTVGVEPLQQYLVELDRGRLQALDIAWDTINMRWFHLYPDQKLKPDDGLYWTGPYKNWNARCAACHQTDFTKNYSPKAKSYNSKWSELTVGCESCHGPGSSHVDWANDPKTFKTQYLTSVNAKGLTVGFPLDNAQKEIQTCATCHSRRSQLGADSPPPGEAYADHYRLSLLSQGLYHADGQVNDEVYVYGSFLQSKMYDRGVRCTNCHDPHSGNLVAEGNAVCTQCHNTAGNTKFPTLKKVDYDSEIHHHHKSGSQGAECVSCHMPVKNYMQVDPRRDHSFRVPRPDLSKKLGTPNTCTSCHNDRNDDWAIKELQQWFKGGRLGSPHYGEVLFAGWSQPTANSTNELIELGLNTKQPGIVRASALELLRGRQVPGMLVRISPLLEDENPMLRRAAAQLFQGSPVQTKIAITMVLQNDPVKTVRLEAARLIIGQPLDGFSEADKKKVDHVIRDYQKSLIAQADFPETQMQIAGLAMSQRNFKMAQAAFQNALSMDPQLAIAWITLARIQMATGESERSLNTLEQGARRVPDNAVIQFELGVLYSSNRQPEKALIAYENSLKLAGPSAVLLEMLATNYMFTQDVEKARAYADRLLREFPLHQPSSLVRQLYKIPR